MKSIWISYLAITQRTETLNDKLPMSTISLDNPSNNWGNFIWDIRQAFYTADKFKNEWDTAHARKNQR